MSPVAQTLLPIYHPKFRKGYQEGRLHYFRERPVLNDILLMEYLQQIFEESAQESAEERDAERRFAVAYQLGQLSGSLIPLHFLEENTPELQKAFLDRIVQKYGDAGASLRQAIEHYWATQDQLAQTLDAELFELMLNRGLERRIMPEKGKMEGTA